MKRSDLQRDDSHPRPAASVLIPSYNHAAYIDEAVRSVLSQEEPQCKASQGLELVIVDDGSSDDSLKRLATYASDPRLRLSTQSNQGAHVALNRALDQARGEYIFILNSDDAFLPGRLVRLVEHLADNPLCSGVATWLEIMDGSGQEIGVKHDWHDLLPWPQPHAGPSLGGLDHPGLALLESNYVATTSNLAFPRRPLDEGLRFLPLRYCHDWDFLLSLATMGELELLEETLVRYRVHGSNTISESGDQAQGLMRFEVLWVVARHAHELIRQCFASAQQQRDLEQRFARSAPRFGREDLLAQLLTLRGRSARPPAAYDALLHPGHPFRRAAVEALSDG